MSCCCCLPAVCLLPTGSARIVEDELGRFFNGLMLDLQGAELTFMSLTIAPGAG